MDDDDRHDNSNYRAQAIEDNQFLNDIDRGVIGIDKPQVVHVSQTPLEILREIQGDWPDKDNDPASSEQGWA